MSANRQKSKTENTPSLCIHELCFKSQELRQPKLTVGATPGPKQKILNKQHKALGPNQKRKGISTPTGTNRAQSQLLVSFSATFPLSLTLKEALKTV